MTSDKRPKTEQQDRVEELKSTVPASFSETPTLMDQSTSGLSASFQPGQSLGKYELRKKLGQGGMGAVYLAYDPMIEREVAIKILPPEVAANEELLKRFLMEARSTGKLNHPNVVAIYDIGNQDDTYYIVMELLTGGSLAEYQAGPEPDAWREACGIVAQAAEGLAAAHAKGLIHRDIKPENLMRSDTGNVKVVDFGLSKVLEAVDDTHTAITKVGQILGTPQYMSPEQFQGHSIDYRSDIYALGGTLFRLLTGKLPYHESTTIVQVMYAHLQQPSPDPCQINPCIPTSCRDIISRAMAKSASDRYQSASAMAADLLSLLNSSPSKSSEPSTSPVDNERTLRSAIIIEPAKLPARMMKDALTKAGAETVDVVQVAAEALQLLHDRVPDVIVTAMQLEDLPGNELLSRIRNDRRLDQSMCLLNSSNSSPERLFTMRTGAGLGVIAKTAQHHELLKAIHAGSLLKIQAQSIAPMTDSSNISALVACETGRIPNELVTLFRQAELLDLNLISIDAMQRDSTSADLKNRHLLLILRTGQADGDDPLATRELGGVENRFGGTIGFLQLTDSGLFLRAIRRPAFSVMTNLPFDLQRLNRLLQICR